jgi:hypothetical protein
LFAVLGSLYVVGVFATALVRGLRPYKGKKISRPTGF